jgi:hypothetical protein
VRKILDSLLDSRNLCRHPELNLRFKRSRSFGRLRRNPRRS